MRPDYDCIIVGAGAAGTIVAALLAEAGKRVLLIERGREMSYASDGRRDHLRNQRLSSHGHNARPDIEGNPRVFVAPTGPNMSCGHTSPAITITRRPWAAAPWFTAPRPGGSCPTISA